MKERMQKISPNSDNCPGKNRTASDGYQEVQAFMGITENNLTEVCFTKDGLLERVLSLWNLNKAYKHVVSNKGKGGVDGMETEGLLPWLRAHKETMMSLLPTGRYKPNPVRIEILSRRIKDGRVISLIHKYLLSGVQVGRDHPFVRYADACLIFCKASVPR